ncbi:MAG: hypothetical protein IJA80_01915 [Clostridia bacterium]|nr:hypothetical protein [Clostridia bacterium]
MVPVLSGTGATMPTLISVPIGTSIFSSTSLVFSYSGFNASLIFTSILDSAN